MEREFANMMKRRVGEKLLRLQYAQGELERKEGVVNEKRAVFDNLKARMEEQ